MKKTSTGTSSPHDHHVFFAFALGGAGAGIPSSMRLATDEGAELELIVTFQLECSPAPAHRRRGTSSISPGTTAEFDLQFPPEAPPSCARR